MSQDKAAKAPKHGLTDVIRSLGRPKVAIMLGLGLSKQQKTGPADAQESHRAEAESYVKRFLQRPSN